ncbi:hypothetical protein PFICI_00356 [Pestalotiopsis fici W106-1]|uniref:DUF924-domain-containing protein n=1 Tax=Pestalotiopsis fici (strain W106-1 / CGMCC3.15140) TaxID=1229662 RepID=W3XKF1_PESFW|nr:uncharacterized protein PFICI_00356 [Pestalotiopsis fici W106-1]ETS86528.1 hypothetical protein PFICI_00356 [Pestalotiopsis fici W106-1]
MLTRHPLGTLVKIQTFTTATRSRRFISIPPDMNSDANRIVTFWFNRNPVEWIIAPKGLDEELKSQFGELVLKARRNELDDWTAQPEGSLALVVLLDQFSRNLFRGTPDALSGDAKATETSTRAIARDFDKEVTVIQASAFYMSLLQQESLITVIAARYLFEALKARCVTDEEHKWVDMGIAASKRHVQQLEKFGRYPTRNAVLGRTNTEAEEEFLKNYNPTL